MRPLSILLLGTQIAAGGAQKILLDQAHWFNERGHKVITAFFYDRDGLYEAWRRAFSFPIIDFNAFKKGASAFGKGFLLFRGVWRLWALLVRDKFDVVITYTQDSNLIGLPLAWAAGVPVRIGTQLGGIHGTPKWREKAHALLVNIGLAQTLIAASKGTRENAVHEGVSPDRIVVIPNGARPFLVDPLDRNSTRQSLGLSDDEVFLLSIGRLVYEKGHEFLVLAMADIIREFPKAKAGICGSGPLKDFLSSLISHHGLEEHVRLLDQQEEILPLLAAADVFVLPSRVEGLSIALLEGMIAELPVVATCVEGVEEVIENGANGLLVPLEDPKALSNAIIQLLKDPRKRQEMGAAARVRVLQEYTSDQMNEKYFQIIAKHLDRSS